MTEVFISYKREDFERVKPLAEALVADGFRIWWDQEIPGGTGWRRSIEDALNTAGCVVVVWSKRSVGPEGEFVHDEAAHAKARGVYLPIIIDPVQPPLGFGQIHTLPLLKWRGNPRDAAYGKVVEAVRGILSVQRPTEAAREPQDVPQAVTHRERPRVAVLPLTHASGEAEQADFADALAEDLIAGLARSTLFSVLPRQSSLDHPTAGPSAAQVCRVLGVDYLVRGVVRRLGRTLRVSIELVSAEAGTAIWSARYERPINDLFDVLDEITLSIVANLEPALLEQEQQRAQAAPQRRLAVWELFVSGRRHFWRSNTDDIRKAESFLERALALDPDDSPSLAFLAHCRIFDVWIGASPDPEQAIASAYDLALKAVSLSGSDAFAHYTLGVVLSMMDRWPEAEAEQRRALELNPFLAPSLGELGRILAFAGDAKGAIAYSDRAINASPNDPHVWLWYRSKAIARFLEDELEGAIRDALDACARGPHRSYLHILLAACYSAAGRSDEAGRTYAEATRLAISESGNAARPKDGGGALKALKSGHPFRKAGDLARYLEALRAARVAATQGQSAN